MYTLSEEAENIIDCIRKELLEATYVYGPMHSAHEGFAILLEEVEELKWHIWQKPALRNDTTMKKEAIQVAAMAIRFIFDICDKKTIG